MEHRWGQRKSVNTSVQLRTQGGVVAIGRMTNVSVSGAFVQTALQAPSLARVQLIVSLNRSHGAALIEAQIVRKTEAGLGLEWDEFGGEKILALITGPQHGHLKHTAAVAPPATRRHPPLKGARSR
ncbi:MAG TPA: PilZ domain-containing protein [Steroidobacteraceae bacterium]